jgi:D-xylose 1-dehydrogenase (NADP+, D-xylono-1,5-lactone-forming)
MDKIIWGILGCSSFARRRTIPAMLASPSVQLLGVASRSLDKSDTYRKEFNLQQSFGSYEEVLADSRIQAVYIPLPNGLHAEWTIKAAERGKHVLCEKPFTANAVEAAHVLEVSAKTGVRIMEAFMWRFHAQHLRAKELLKNGAIGRLRLVRSSFSFLLERSSNFRFSREMAGGSILDIGCYPISAARFYFEDEPISVFARGRFEPEFGVDMGMEAILDFAQGRAVIDCAFDLPYHTNLELVGEKGIIKVSKPWRPDGPATIFINDQLETIKPEDQYINQFEHFSRCLISGTAPLYGPEDSLRQMRVVDAMFRSISAGAPERI